MNTTQAKHFLLSVDEEKFINWYNNSVVDPYGDFFYSTIRENNSEELFSAAKELFTLETFVNLCRNSQYSEVDRYAMFTDNSVISFNTIEEFLNLEYYGSGLVDYFLDNEEESKEELK